MAKFADLLGSLGNYFKLGITGVRLKNSSGNLLIRNTGDTADASITASQLLNSGDSLIINSDAVNSGSDYTITLTRPSSGMSGAITLTLPTTAGSTGQALITNGSGVLSWTTLSAGASSVNTDTTAIAFGSTSPLAAFSLPANAVVEVVRVFVDTTYNGSPSLSVGITGTTAKYLASNQVDLTQSAGTIFEVYPGLIPSGSPENIIITYAAGGATTGAGRVEVDFVVPS